MMDTNTSEQEEQPNKRPWLRWLIEGIIILAIIFGLRTWQQRGMLIGEAPDFERPTLSGNPVRLDNYRGKPVLLHFWASWCPICELEQGSITALAKDWKVITVAFKSGGKEEVQRYMERKGMTDWVTIVDDEGSLAAQYGVHGAPTDYVLDEEGMIRFREVGITSGWGLRVRLWLADSLPQ